MTKMKLHHGVEVRQEAGEPRAGLSKALRPGAQAGGRPRAVWEIVTIATNPSPPSRGEVYLFALESGADK